MIRPLSILFFILVSPFAMAQELDYQEIDTNNVSSWFEKYPRAYAGVYKFGNSASESDLVIIYAKNTLVVQISQFEWNDSASQFFNHYETLTNVKISNGKFESDQYKGRFVYYLDGETKQMGLRINNPWTVGIENRTWELGLKSKHPFNCEGQYPEATTKFLYKSDLEKMSILELKYMRNEIFARYGYIFRAGGKIDEHFKATNWYRPQHKNVDGFLTPIEKKNVELIQSLEK